MKKTTSKRVERAQFAQTEMKIAHTPQKESTEVDNRAQVTSTMPKLQRSKDTRSRAHTAVATSSLSSQPKPSQSPTASSGLSSMSEPPLPDSQLDEFRPLFNALVKLARKSYSPFNSNVTIAADYIALRSAVAAFFEENSKLDSLSDGNYSLCFEMQSICQILELNVRPQSGFHYREIKWPIPKMEDSEEHALKTKAYKVVDSLVFGIEKGNKGRAKKKGGKLKKNGRVKGRDSGYSSGKVCTNEESGNDLESRRREHLQ